MSYEVVNVKKAPCACGNGVVTLTVSENDWNQTRESIAIECEACKLTHRVESKYCCPKPKHDYTLYYLVEKANPDNKIPLDL